MDHSATYSPEDNKIRIYPAHRLSAEDYARVKAAGFSWAPKQEVFVAPMWTPAREDLAREFCPDGIGDEDTSLCARAEDRAERFEGYKANRTQDAEQARAAVARIADGIPLGQPILVGHHSERHARKDAERIENGMRRAVQMWETAEYWRDRAAGAIRHAKYKESAPVRARRIKTLEADLRKQQRATEEAEKLLRAWQEEGLTLERAKFIANHDHVHVSLSLTEYPAAEGVHAYEGSQSLWSALDGGRITAEQAQTIAVRAHERGNAHRARWVAHYENRLTYERAMLAEGGGIAAERFDLQPGGRVKCGRWGWGVILRVNRKDGRAQSVSIAGQSWTTGVEDIQDYEPPTEERAAAVAKVTAAPPLCNYESEGCARMTSAEWAKIYTDAKGTRVTKATEEHGAHRRRVLPGYIAREYGATKTESQWGMVPVLITDAKVTPAPLLNPPPKPARKSTARKIAEAAGIDTTGQADPEPVPAAPAIDARAVLAEAAAPDRVDVIEETARLQRANEARAHAKEAAAPFDAMRQALRTGTAVQVVAAPQLFPTPRDVAQRMADLAEIEPGCRVLEPSAGTGMLLGAIGGRPWGAAATVGHVHAVEINGALASALRRDFPLTTVHNRDFLELTPETFQPFDVVLMNPPFKDGADIQHIQHARRFLAPGGRLVAICAAGPRQHAALQPLADSWEYLEPGTFAGTSARAVLLTMGA